MSNAITVKGAYEAIPMHMPADGSRASILSELVRAVCGIESVFSDHQKGCKDSCYKDKNITDMCRLCRNRMETVMASLLKPDSFIWEVWKEQELVGIIRFSDVRKGEDAKAHYVFTDADLRGKTGVMRSIIEWAFNDHEETGWKALKRLTIEVPDFAYALARHASKKLGFGGPFTWTLPSGGPTVEVEGVKRGAVLWHGQPRDLLLLGLLNPN